jgi:hypothetical protein
MTIFLDRKQVLSSRSDVARLLGLRSDARRRDISSAFGRATRCDAWLRLEEDPVMECGDEYWEIRIFNLQPKCRIYMRQGQRGAWIQDVADIPDDVLRFFGARGDKSGRIVSNRSWKSWERMRWLSGRGRRLKGRQGEIHASIEIPGVRRPTGEVRSTLLIEPIGAPRPDEVAPVRLVLPVMAREIGKAVEKVREVYEAQAVPA